MITAKIDRKEINRIASKARKFGSVMKLEVAKDLAKSAYQIDADAKRRVQSGVTNFGGLVSQIRTRPVSSDKLTWLNSSGANYSAYIEFGTGKSVDLTHLVKAGFPSSWALQFKGRGVKRLNLQPRPFMFPSINKEQPKLKARLKETIKHNGKKF